MGRESALPAGSTVGARTAARLDELRATPAFLADETEENLCARRPPFGLKDGVSRIQAIIKFSRSYNSSLRLENQSADALCMILASEMRRV